MAILNRPSSWCAKPWFSRSTTGPSGQFSSKTASLPLPIRCTCERRLGRIDHHVEAPMRITVGMEGRLAETQAVGKVLLNRCGIIER